MGWRKSAPATLINHLAQCPFAPPEMKSRAASDRRCTLASSRPRSSHGRDESRSQSRTDLHIVSPPSSPPLYPQQAPNPYFDPNALTNPSTLFSQSEAVPPPLQLNVAAAMGYAPSPSPGISATPSPLSSSFPSPVAFPTRPISRSASQPAFPSPLNPTTGQRKRRPFDDATQERFETRVMRLTASANLPLSWVDNLEWIRLCEEFIPKARPISRKHLTRVVLPRVVRQIREQVRKAVKAKEATLQADGWSGVNRHHYIGFMISVNGKVCGR